MLRRAALGSLFNILVLQWTNSLKVLRVDNVQLEVIANERWIYPAGRNLAMFSANIRPWQVPGYNQSN